jgi:hypothetical protein
MGRVSRREYHSAYAGGGEMKKTIAILALAASGAVAETDSGLTACYAMGDSLTSPSYSWANQLNKYGLAHIQVDAIPGRALTSLEIPYDRKKTGEIDCAIIHLGSNDMGAWDRELYIKMYSDHIQLLEGNGLEVFCILPPYNEVWDVEPARAATLEVCPDALDVPTGFYTDGVHMDSWGHAFHGVNLLSQIEERRGKQ